jgi:hypothetical protein
MSRLSRLTAGAVVALALAAPAGAEQQPASPAVTQSAAPSVLTVPAISGPPTAVVLRIEGGFSPHERWVWFDGDGTARLRGMLIDGGGGRFQSHQDFKAVRTVLDDAQACAPKAAVSRPIIGNDVFHYRVDVRCGKTWRVMRDWARPAASEATDTPDMWKIVHGLEALAYRLTWSPTDDDVALPNAYPMFRFASPAKTTG